MTGMSVRNREMTSGDVMASQAGMACPWNTKVSCMCVEVNSWCEYERVGALFLHQTASLRPHHHRFFKLLPIIIMASPTLLRAQPPGLSKTTTTTNKLTHPLAEKQSFIELQRTVLAFILSCRAGPRSYIAHLLFLLPSLSPLPVLAFPTTHTVFLLLQLHTSAL